MKIFLLPKAATQSPRNVVFPGIDLSQPYRPCIDRRMHQ
jgi:hypothetical protein